MKMLSIDEFLDKNKVAAMGGVALAFVGDAVHSLYVRKMLVLEKDYKTGDLNKLSSEIVCAKAQSDFVEKLMSVLTEDELAVFKRARNAKKGTRAKHASVTDYNNATGFEAVLGYLYLSGDRERLDFLLNYGG
ncbi:MAG: Mini-ribonuclease 3 [Clostridia bacterium]|nr:Mini-ribonuclease 3 [Clostridia bacterium]